MKETRENCLDESSNEQEDMNEIKLDATPLNPMVFYSRFQHITEKIFKKSDKNSLKNFREVARIWQKSIDNQDILWNKIVKKENRNESFRLACIVGHSKIAEMLMNKHSNPKIDFNAICGISGQYEKYGDGRTAFQWACWNDHPNIGKSTF